MGAFSSEAAFARAGRLACACGAYFGPSERPWREPGTPSLSAGFAFSVLAQALVVSVLPLAGVQTGRGAAWAGVPFAVMLLGAVVATLPASHLLDRFGRRAAFALGASLGIAGGLLVAFAVLRQDFTALCLGAFWLGIAQGFGLFYRHAAALAPGSNPSASATVLAAGVLAGLAGPWISAVAEDLAQPVFLLGTVLAATAAQVIALAFAVAVPEPPVSLAFEGAPRGKAPAPFLSATALAAAAWFVMIGCMTGAPLAMMGCGIGIGGIAGAVAWHLVGMYVPALFAARLVSAAGAVPTALGGLGLALCGAAWVWSSTRAPEFSFALVMVGAGWGVTVSSATIHLHFAAAPRPSQLAAHDAFSLLAALLASGLAGWAAAGLPT